MNRSQDRAIRHKEQQKKGSAPKERQKARKRRKKAQLETRAVHLLRGMFIDNLHIVYLAFPPLETNLPLIVDSDRVPVRGIGRAIGSPDPIVLHCRGAVECPQLAQSDPLNLFRDLSGSLAAKNLFRLSGFERFDHEDILTEETTRTWTTL
jgi:hypothetical protein